VSAEPANVLTTALKEQIVEAFTVKNKLGKQKVMGISIIYSTEITGAYRETDPVEQLYG